MDRVAPATRLKTFRGPWKGQLLLACGKCQRRLRHGEDAFGLGKVKKALRQLAKLDAEPVRLRVVTVPCLKVCPRAGVAVCTQAQLGQGRGSIVRTDGDLQTLYEECRADEQALEAAALPVVQKTVPTMPR